MTSGCGPSPSPWSGPTRVDAASGLRSSAGADREQLRREPRGRGPRRAGRRPPARPGLLDGASPAPEAGERRHRGRNGGGGHGGAGPDDHLEASPVSAADVRTRPDMRPLARRRALALAGLLLVLASAWAMPSRAYACSCAGSSLVEHFAVGRGLHRRGRRREKRWRLLSRDLLRKPGAEGRRRRPAAGAHQPHRDTSAGWSSAGRIRSWCSQTLVRPVRTNCGSPHAMEPVRWTAGSDRRSWSARWWSWPGSVSSPSA